jgi:hypothetical protein
VLKIRIDGREDVAAGDLPTPYNCTRQPPLLFAAQDDKLWVTGLNASRHFPRLIGTAVIHNDHFIAVAQRGVERTSDALEERLDVHGFVVGRHYK